MPRRAAAKSEPVSAAEGASPRLRRRRQSNVGDLILKLLAASPLTGQELLKQGKFSAAALYIHAKALRKSRQIAARRDGRQVVFSLVSTGRRSATAEAAPEKTAEGVHLSAVSSELQAALDAVTFRLTAAAQLQDKIMVLDQLARNMPPPVSDLLRSTIDDLAKLTR